MKCLFLPYPIQSTDKIELTGDDYHHIAHVFRMKMGESIEIKDGNFSYTVQLLEFQPQKAIFTIINKRNLIEPKLRITLVQSILKNDAFHLLLQKVTELGVTKIIPYLAERSVVKINPVEYGKKIIKWMKICEEASKQCGRDYLPLIHPITSDIRQISFSTPNKIIGNELESCFVLKSLFEKINPTFEIIIWIGPEGGFSDYELEIAAKTGFRSCKISDHILRSETAAIFIVSNCFFYFG